jgi:hypothetical protein
MDLPGRISGDPLRACRVRIHGGGKKQRYMPYTHEDERTASVHFSVRCPLVMQAMPT